MGQLISFDDKDISTDYTALQSKVVTIDTGIIKYYLFNQLSTCFGLVLQS